MSDGFSIDDILAEVDKKRGASDGDSKKPELDEILTVKPEPRQEPSERSVNSKTSVSARNIGVTEILDEKKIRGALRERDSMSVTRILNGEELKKRYDEEPHSARVKEPPAHKRAPTQSAPNASGSDINGYSAKPEKEDKPDPLPERKQRGKHRRNDFPTADIIFRKAKVMPKPLIDPDGLELKETAPSEAPPASVTEIFEKPAPPASLEKREKPNKGASFSIGESKKTDDAGASGIASPVDTVGFIFPGLEGSQRIDDPKTEALKKRGEAILERDLSLEKPLEQIDALNPYDMLPEQDDGRFISVLSGDTKGIADGDLKELSGKNQGASAEAATSEVVKAYVPNTPNSVKPAVKAEQREKAASLNEKVRRSNTALIESLNKAIKEKRASDVKAYRTLPVEGALHAPEDKTARVLPLTHGLNIDYKKQILTDTSLPLTEDPQLLERRMNELAGKRKRKIRDFVLEDIDEDKDPNDYDGEDERAKDEYEDYDTAKQTWQDLCETHKGLRIRFLILFIITGVALFLAFMNDLGFNMAFNILGVDVKFMDKRWSPTGFLYLNLMLGILGAGTCSTVITGGLSKLFSGRGDCDSLCAVPAVLTVISVVPMLSGTDYIQRGHTGIFVAAALCGLLFNTAGKLMMMARAKRNFRFVSGDSTKFYAEIIEDEQVSRAFTKGVLYEHPVLCTMRKTGFLTDFLKNSYCDDKADQLSRYITPAAFGAALIIGISALFIPNGHDELKNNIFWALTAANFALCMLSPISVMFLVNNPLLRASKALAKNDAVVLGYNSAEKFSKVNSVLVDAASLFPAGSVDFRNLKRCQQNNSLNHFAIDDAIIIAASLAIKSGSILASMFTDMIAGKNELLYSIDNCIYEVNMGISGWMGSKRVMLGNRDQMKHHAIKVPDARKERKYSEKYGDVVYLAVGGETIAMFFIKIIPNESIKNALQELQKQGIAVIVRTRDSLVTVNSLADAFELAPEKLKIIPFDLHAKFDDCLKYSSRGDGNVACSGTFSSFAKAVAASKKIMHNIMISSTPLFTGLFIAAALCLIFTVFAKPGVFTSTNIMLYNGFFFAAMMLMQGFKKY